MSTNGFFVISLDFELMWGMFDKVTLEQYGRNIMGVHTVLPELLSILEQNNIHATWATVGMLMSKDRQTLLSSLPNEAQQPRYPDMKVSSYEYIKKSAIGENETSDPYHYGLSLVEKIVETPYQELGSHTFSHYYCLDGSENSKAIFAADCEAFKKMSAQFTVPVTSIVFPRNQTKEEALHVCKEFGFTSYRGTPSHFLYTGKREKEQTNIFLRLLRLIDAYINISGHHTFTLQSTKESILTNVKGSRFLRPYSTTFKALEPMRINRIKKSMMYAAKNNQIFHLWWHPHNFGINRKENIQNLLEIIEHYKILQEKYGMQSANMGEISELSE